MCAICQDSLNQEGKQVEALPCMHVFHEVCLQDWRLCTGKPQDHCPMRCHEASNFDLDPDDIAAAPEQPEAVVASSSSSSSGSVFERLAQAAAAEGMQLEV